MLQKTISTILIIAVVLSLSFNLFLFKTKEAKALDGGGSWMVAIKELALDAVGWTVSDLVIKPLTQRIIDWGQGRTSDSGESLRVLDYISYFKNALAVGAAKYIVEFRKTEIEPAIKNVLEDLGFATNLTDLPTYAEYARSTLQDDLGDNYQEFVDSGYSLEAGGWAGWFSMIKPENNIFGQALMAGQERRRMELAEKEAADKKTDVSGGYKNEEATSLSDVDACIGECQKKTIADPSFNYQKCVTQCESETVGYAIETKIKNVGSDIRTHMESALSADMQRIISVKEITQLLGILFSSVINRGLTEGMEFLRSVTTQEEEERSSSQDFLYYDEFKANQTLEDKKDTRSKILTGILSAVQKLSRSITECEDKKEMLKYTDYARNIADVLNSYVEALYVGLEGVNLKPDFNILDPRFAPFTVYGYSYGQVPANKFPSKCKTITEQLNLGINATCTDIISGLEPINPVCQSCMYDHSTLNCPPEPYPPEPYPESGNEPWTEDILSQKNEFYWSCRAPYNTALKRCETCLKKADEQCSQEDRDARSECIEKVCSNYQGIEDQVVSPPDSGLEFHRQCLMEERKEACFTCLREYFVPATYCEQTIDYTARSIIKYPVVVWAKHRDVTQGFPWFGLFDAEFANEMGGKCIQNDCYPEHCTYEGGFGPLNFSLICRIIPNFTNEEGEKVCEQYCDITQEQLRDITDFRPNDNDCSYRGGSTIAYGGNDPWWPINEGLFYLRSKCCATAWQHDEGKYNVCIGAGSTYGEEEAECCYYETVDYAPVVEPTLDLTSGQSQICFKVNNVNAFSNDDNKSTVFGIAGEDNAHYIQIRHRISDGDHTLQPKTGFCFGCDSINEDCGWCVAETTDRLSINSGDTWKIQWAGYSVTLTNTDTGESSSLDLSEYSDYDGLDLAKYCRGGTGCSWPQHNTYPDSNASVTLASCPEDDPEPGPEPGPEPPNPELCGNDTCDRAFGETIQNCPEDCLGREY